MKNLKECLVNESQTKFLDIENYGRTWVSEWGPSYFGNILTSFVKGMKTGMEKNKHDDEKFQKRCTDFIDKLLEDINKEIY